MITEGENRNVINKHFNTSRRVPFAVAFHLMYKSLYNRDIYVFTDFNYGKQSDSQYKLNICK